MTKSGFCILIVIVVIVLGEDVQLAKQIRDDPNLSKVLQMAKDLIKTGFDAGGGYQQVWIRDSNTFLEIATEVIDSTIIRQVLLNFFSFQNTDGNIIDGYDPKTNQTFKNTVETDQETSLVQALYKYITNTGDTSILQQTINGITVLDRVELAFQYLLKNRYSSQYDLLWGGTTVDWGDVQPEDNPGIIFDANSHPAIDIYDNAMFVIGIKNYMGMLSNTSSRYVFWMNQLGMVEQSVRKYLWNVTKFIPHIYLEKGSPFPKDFPEQSIYYHGGTAIAIEAGLLTHDEIHTSLLSMINNKQSSGALSIGLTVYPTYPSGIFKNPGMGAYSYQNGGDWTWFGGRMIQQLVANGFVQEALQEIQPMVLRVIENNDFWEWYSVLTHKPMGSNNYRGSAGVLGKAIKELLSWANKPSA